MTQENETPNPEEHEAPEDQPAPASDAPQATNLNPEQVARFVTSIKNPVQQMGEHVLGALQHPNTMAVLTTIVVGPDGQQHIVSAALDPQKTAQVNMLLQGAVEEREEEEICVGFHCLVKPKGEQVEPEESAEAPE